MADDMTTRMALPLLLPAQAQKHVTVNEALMRLDGQVDLVLQSVTRVAPPATVSDGLCWGIPVGATGAWEEQSGKIAIGANGGWIFVQPQFGRRALVADKGLSAIHDGTRWVVGAVTLGQHGAGMIAGQLAEDLTLTTGSVINTSMVIPTGAMVIGVTARVLNAVTGTLTSWAMGNADSLNRFGQGHGKEAGTWVRGILSAPMTFWTPTPLRLSATGGQFSSGKIRIVLHYWELRVPD